MIKKILIKNYKLFEYEVIKLNEDINIFVGENDSGKSTLLEAISIATTGRINGKLFDRQLKTNLFNNKVRENYIKSIKKDDNNVELPEIVIEVYLDNEYTTYSGTNNELREDCPGIRVEVSLNDNYSDIYKEMLNKKEIFDIPIELYSVKYNYFNAEIVSYRTSPIKGILIDTTRRDYSYVMDRFVTSNITTYLSERERTDLSTAYRTSRRNFQENEVVEKLNDIIREKVKVNNKQVSIDLREERIDDWQNQMSVIVEETPFDNLGFGSQNIIKMELAIKNSSDQVNIIMLEEPENNLSFTNMTKLVGKILESQGKQAFISTHSSYIVNKLNLGKIILFDSGRISSLKELPEDTKNYFNKLPGYDTLRLILAEKVVLVEGPTDELIIQRAYLDEYGKLPISDGVDVIVVDSLAFKRYCDMALLLNKKIVIVTDNDGDIKSNITDKYSEYMDNENLIFLYEKDEDLTTLEKSVLEVNSSNDNSLELFKTVISKNNSVATRDKEGVLSFMLKNKTEWALRVFESNNTIEYPEYIKDVIKQCN